MHTDESVNAYIVGQMLAGAAFHYDPVDRHGPALAALALPLVRLEGAKDFPSLTESGLRLTSVIMGSATVLFFAAAVEPFGFLPCLVAALLFAFAPLSVYYSRDFIHETIFVAATLGLFCAGWRAVRRASMPAAIAAGACAALMLATKETAALHFAAIAMAAIVAWFVSRKPSAALSRLPFRVFAATLVSFLLVALLLFTWFGQNWKVFSDLVQAAPDAMARAGGQGHEKPFWYYFQLFAGEMSAKWFAKSSGNWSGAVLTVLALAGFVVAFLDKTRRTNRWLALYFLLITVIYCAIPYKTPWLALNLFLPAALLIGLVIGRLWQASARPAFRTLLLVFCAVLGILIAHDTRQRVFINPTDETNSYAYVQTSEDLLGLPDRLNELVQQRHLVNPRIAVIAADPWPLPWYLRKYSQTGFWQPGQQTGTTDFFITSTDAADQYQEQLKDFRPEFFGLRPNVLIILWVRAEN